MDRKVYDEYIAILKEELVPAMGCTEPIALAFGAAKAREVLGRMPEKIIAKCSGNIVKNVKFTGGCNGNLQAVSRLVAGKTVDEVESTLSGIRCGMKSTSCGDQLSKAVRAAYNAQQ